MSKTKEALSPSEVAAYLKQFPGWKKKGDAISKTYDYDNYLNALEFVDALAREANRVDHHPDIMLKYGEVTVTYATHSAGGVTDADFEGARTADRLHGAA